MRQILKKLIFDIEPSVYALFAVCAFCAAGAFIIHLLPDGYALIYARPLFAWLDGNRRWDTFWLYGAVALFGFAGLTGSVCLVRDVSKKRIVTACCHGCFLLVLVAHFINSLSSFRIVENVLPRNIPQTIPLPPPARPLNIRLDSVSSDRDASGMMRNIKARLSYIEANVEKSGEIEINAPLKTDRYHVVLKDVASYLNAVTLALSDGRKESVVTMHVDRPYTGEGFRLIFQAHNPDFSQLKIVHEEGSLKETVITGIGQKLRLANKTYTVTQIIPDILPSVIVDISYDPSLMLMLAASTIFTAVITVDGAAAFVRAVRRRTEETPA